MRALRVLVVEDNVLVGVLLGELLTDLGHEVCGIVRTEAAAVLAAGRESPDLMIVDMELAQGTGASAMRSILQTATMPYVFMSGSSRHAMPAGAILLQKPFGELSLVNALECAMESHQPS
jgi:CheY-like chemotaxis protein